MASTNNMLLAIAAAFLAVLFQPAASQYDVVSPNCPFNDESQMPQILAQCVGDNEKLRELIMNRDSPQISAEAVEVACANSDGLAKAGSCVLDKAKDCLPLPDGDIKKSLLDLIPDQGKLKEAIDYMCKNREGLTGMTCFAAVQEPVTECASEKAMEVFQKVSQDTSAIKESVCQVVDVATDCMRKNKGSCQDESVDTAVGLINILSPCNSARQAGVTVLLLVAAVVMSFFNKIY